MKYVLGIDIGTGSVKAVAVDLKGRAFAHYQLYYSYSSPKPGYHEQAPEEIWQAFKNCIKGIVAKTGTAPVAVGLSSAMHSLIPVDKNCTPLSPMITWADNRSADIAKRLRGSMQGINIYKVTGTPLHAMSPLCKIIWIRENTPALFNSAYKFISIKEYIWHRLFDVFELDQSGASCMGLFNIYLRSWHSDALILADITEGSLSAVVPTDHVRNYALTDDLLPLHTPVLIGASDGCLANLGSMADKPGIAAVTVGTSGAVRVCSNNPLPNEKAMTFSYILDDKTFICGGPINNGGIALQWWLKNIKPDPDENDYAELFRKIGAIPAGSGGLIFLPYITGERAPVWNSETCGTFFGIKLQHTQAYFSRAVLEGICYALKDVLNAVQENSEPITQINISGGIVKSDIWLQILADITEKRLIVVQNEDASAVGAAFMALKKTGIMNDYPTPNIDNLKVFMPQPEHAAIHRANLKVYKLLYENLKGVIPEAYNLRNTPF